MAPQLRLTSTTGVEFLARLVYKGERYGNGHQLVNTGYRTLVEFSMPRGVGDTMIAVYAVEDLPTDIPGWKPGGVPQLEMSPSETERLLRWIDDPNSETESVVLLVGDEAELDKAAVALGRLRLATRREADGVRALSHARAMRPAIVVIGRDTGSMGPLEVAAKLAASAQTREVPVILFGGPDGGGAQVSLRVQSGDYAALVEGASELLDLV